MPQLRFVLRASGIFAVLLAVWWVALRGPLLDWVQFSSEIVLQSLPGVHSPTGVSIETGRVWNLQVPIPGGRSVHIKAEERIPTMYTVTLPLYWAVLLAAWTRRAWRALLAGTAILLLVQPLSLLVYAAHVVKLNLYPNAAPWLGHVLDYTDYLTMTFFPPVLPVLLALALYPDLRKRVLAG
jgi:hypothetical protein